MKGITIGYPRGANQRGKITSDQEKLGQAIIKKTIGKPQRFDTLVNKNHGQRNEDESILRQ